MVQVGINTKSTPGLTCGEIPWDCLSMIFWLLLSIILDIYHDQKPDEGKKAQSRYAVDETEAL
jgi:hypothetical protein